MSFSEFLKRFLAVLFILLLWAGAWAGRSTLLMGFAAAVIAVGISIPVGWLVRRGWQRGWAITVSSMAVGLGATLLLLFVVPRLVVELFNLFSSIPAAVSSLTQSYAELRLRNEFLIAALPELPSATVEASNIAPDRARAILTQFINAGLAIAPSLVGGLGAIAAILVNLVFVLFISIFFLVDPQSYIRGSLYLVPAHYHARALEIWNNLYLTIQTWLTALFLSISITVTLVWLILGLLLGMPNAIVVAVFAGLATFVPNVGVFLPLIPIAIFTLADEPAQIFIMIPVYLLIQLVESNVITPSIVKAELNIPPGIMMLFQLLITIAFGALGLLLAVPLFASLMVLVREIYSYDMLKLRHTTVAIDADASGRYQLVESAVGNGRGRTQEIAALAQSGSTTSAPATQQPIATPKPMKEPATRRKRRAKK